MGPWRGSVFSGQDHYGHALTANLLDKRRAVLACLRDQMFCRAAFDQTASLCTIRRSPLRQNDSEQHTMRIHGQRYLGVAPLFVRLLSSVPPLASAACGCTVQWLAPSISHS